MRVLFDEAVPERGLSAWSMERFDLEDGTEVTDSYLDLISTCYRTNMKTRTDDLLGTFKAFVRSDSPLSEFA